MASDRELQELAAKAAGLAVFIWGSPGAENFTLKLKDGSPGNRWNPLTDDGDALRLAVKLSFVVNICAREDGRGVTAIHRGSVLAQEQHFGEPEAATRRAIVRAAAEIGKLESPLPSDGAATLEKMNG